MRIIIAGAGDVGFHLAKLLAYETQDIILVDLDADKLKYAANHIDVFTIHGNATSYSVLDEAGISRADLLIAVTNSENANLTTAIIGKHLGAKKTVARIENLEFLLDREKLDLKKLGIDELISPESLAAREIKRLLKESALTDTFDFDGGMLSMVGIHINNQGQLVDKTLEETAHLNPDDDFTTVAILRNNQTIIPRGKTRFLLNDHAYFITKREGVDRILALTGKKRVEIKNVMILGGSKAGYHAARKLGDRYNVKLIEIDRDRCFEMAEKLNNTLVLNGDGRDVEFLEEEGIENMDAFIAVTGNSETNIISCLVAKNHGVAKTIALVENTDYIHLSQNIGVDTMINKRLIAANFIFRYIRQGEIVSLTGIHGVEAEILEYEVKEGSKITSGQIKDLNFPKSAIIGGVIRDNHPYIANGDFQLEGGDRVVVFSQPECIHKVENYFK